MNRLNAVMFFYAVFTFCACLRLHSQQQSISLREARVAFNHFELKKSMEIYTKVASSKTLDARNKVEALQNLAFQKWTFYKEYKESIQYLKAALVLNVETSKTYLLYSQINLESFKFKNAYKYVEKAFNAATDENDKIAASLLKAQIINEESNTLAKTGMIINKNKLSEATALLKYVLQKQPGNPVPSELLLNIALLNKNGSDILNAWKAYYFITDENNINQVLKQPYAILQTLLPNWKDRELTTEEKITLTKALAYSNFYNSAVLLSTSKVFGQVIKPPLLAASGIDKILQFNDFAERVKKINNNFYPKIAAGLKNYDSAYAKEMTNAAKTLWIHLDSQNTYENYKEELFFDLIKEKFGALGYIGTTNGFYSMLLGLIIHNEIKEVKQYGYTARFQYISISRLISKDFTSWQGSANVGGWGTDSSMVQVRDAYLQAPFTNLRWVSDSSSHEKIVREIASAKAIDIIVCKKDKYAQPAYLMRAIRLKASEYLYDSLKKAGLKDESLAIAFISETLRFNIESTIFGHEGRHAIDQLFFKKEFDTWTDDEKELRAKFSEIIFSPKIKLAHTGSFLGGDLDSTTAHGKANARLRKIFVDWMETHIDELKNVDKQMPLIMQLDLLSDEQLIKLCMEADPIK